MESSVLFKSSDNTVVVIDIPRTLEEAQVLPGQTISRRIVSSRPVGEPWQVPEPKKDIAKYVAPSAAVAELMTLGSVKAALKTARADHDGPWYLPRVTHKQAKELDPPVTGGVDADENGNGTANANANATQSQKRKYTPSSLSPEEDSKDGTSRSPFIPEQSYHLPGTIESQREVFLQNAPQFDLIILDPPWPSRSVKRKSDRYATVYTIEEARDLLTQIPVASHLKRDGLVAVWITNKTTITDMLTAPGGVLAQWDVEPVGEWIWLKVTSAAEPVFDVELAWRKPWERLLIARKRGSSTPIPAATKVIVGVPDVHSRKPNLKGLFEDILPQGYLGLEIFARNLTAGWWSWGNEVMFFQQTHHWVAIDDEPAGRL